MAVVEVRTNLWEALAGRAPGVPLAPADHDVWRTIVERLNPAKARPRIREGVEAANLTTVRGVDYVMLRSPDRGESCYQRLSLEEHALAMLMDGTRTVASLVAEFLRISGRLSPDQVRRVVAELAANRMLDELPVDAFAPLQRIRRVSWPRRFGRGLLAFARGRRMVLANIDPLITVAYRFGGRVFFTRVASAAMVAVAMTGLGVFGWVWARGAQSAFLVGNSYALGALTLLGLNVLALCSHEMGHALAAKHAGRKVPAAGFLLYFGIPSAFVDTTDVWMAGRRARLQTTAAGPAAALTLAGTAQLVGLAYPALAAVCFKLSFAWYLNSLFNLNPLMALDGYYLLMDWFEVPNLRARGLAYILLTFRLRRPKWSTLDREGRFVALYGVLSLLWLLIAMNLLYRVYLDRIGGLVTGLWHVGIGARMLLVAIVVALAAPLVYSVLGWLGRGFGRIPGRLRERRRTKDLPNRLDALRVSALAALPTQTLAELARAGRWVRPRSGTTMVAAGAQPSAVYVVADGSLEARAPGDATGCVRERATRGDLIGAAPVLTGAASSLTWTTVGTKLLALPTSRFLALVGPVADRVRHGIEGATVERSELERLLGAAALTGMTEADRIALLATSRPIDLAVGETHEVAPGGVVALVGAGVLTGGDGREIRRGDMLVAGDTPTAATARSQSRLWSLPVDGGFTLLLGGAPNGLVSQHDGQVVHTAPSGGLHPATQYPPLEPPVGPPPADDGTTDRRLGRAGRRLALMLLMLLLLAIFANTKAPITWAEMPSDSALMTVVTGNVEATLAAHVVVLGKDERRYVRHGDAILVGRDSLVRLTFRGGGVALLCGGARLFVGALYTVEGDPAQPTGELDLKQGRAFASTQTASSAFASLTLRFTDAARVITNDGPARYTVSPGGLAVAQGKVTLDGTPQLAGDALPGCGSGGGIAGPGQPGPGQEDPGGVGPTPDLSPDVGGNPTEVVGTPASTGPAETSPAAPANQAPAIDWVRSTSLSLSQVKTRGVCSGGPTSTVVTANVHDAETSAVNLVVTMTYSLAGHPEVAGTATMAPATPTGSVFTTTLGPIQYATAHAAGGAITVTVRAIDTGNKAALPKNTSMTLASC